MSVYLSIFLIIIGGLLIFASLKTLIKANNSSWKTTNGTITSSKELAILEFSSETIVPRKEPSVVYEYCVEGNHYSNSNVYNVDNNIEVDTKTEEILTKFPPGKNVSVHYNENNPKESYLEYASVTPVYLYFLLGCCIFFLGVIFCKIL